MELELIRFGDGLGVGGTNGEEETLGSLGRMPGSRGGATGVEAGHPRHSAGAVVKGKHNIEHGV